MPASCPTATTRFPPSPCWQAYEDALAADPACLQAQYNAGLACRQLGLPDRALAHYTALLGAAPGHAEAMWQVGQCAGASASASVCLQSQGGGLQGAGTRAPTTCKAALLPQLTAPAAQPTPPHQVWPADPHAPRTPAPLPRRPPTCVRSWATARARWSGLPACSPARRTTPERCPAWAHCTPSEL